MSGPGLFRTAIQAVSLLRVLLIPPLIRPSLFERGIENNRDDLGSSAGRTPEGDRESRENRESVAGLEGYNFFPRERDRSRRSVTRKK